MRAPAHETPDSDSPSKPQPPTSRFGGLHSAELPCAVCQRITGHRVLRVHRERRSLAGQLVEGIARCSQCRWTHPFRLEIPDRLRVRAVVSEGNRSSPISVDLPATQRLLVGSRIPEHDPPLRILRIDTRSGSRTTDALARDVGTVWLTPDKPRPIPVSLVLGSKTAVTRADIPPDRLLQVGGTLEVAGGILRVVGLRARNRTWSHGGDQFPAREVTRIYTRRMESPPAGSNRWSRFRDSPSSRATSASRSDRRRSSPGVRIKRSRPRPRNASGGATTHRSSPS